MPWRALPLVSMTLFGGLSACTFGGGGILPTSFSPSSSYAPPPVAERDLDVPYVPTPRAAVAGMLDLAELTPQDYLIDLGSGDGRIVVAAAQRGARGLGVDIDPVRVREGVAAAQLAGVENRATFRQQDIFETPLREATVVTAYLLPAINLRLRPRLLTELRPGTRLVTHAFMMGDWQPDAQRVVEGRNLYLWIIPAVAGGTWAFTEGSSQMVLTLEQRFQQVSGTLAGGGRTLDLSNVTLRGTRLAFTAGGRNYVGRIEDNRIIGEGGWSATRTE